MTVCTVPECYGPTWGANSSAQLCARHLADRNGPPMKVTCECSTPDIESLRIYGADAAQCRRCGSPIEGTLV